MIRTILMKTLIQTIRTDTRMTRKAGVKTDEIGAQEEAVVMATKEEAKMEEEEVQDKEGNRVHRGQNPGRREHPEGRGLRLDPRDPSSGRRDPLVSAPGVKREATVLR